MDVPSVSSVQVLCWFLRVCLIPIYFKNEYLFLTLQSPNKIVCLKLKVSVCFINVKIIGICFVLHYYYFVTIIDIIVY